MKNTKLFFNGIKDGFQEPGHTLASTVNFFLLTLVFILGIGIVSLLSKIVKKRYLPLKSENKNSYWEKVDIGGEKKKEEYLKPF